MVVNKRINIKIMKIESNRFINVENALEKK